MGVQNKGKIAVNNMEISVRKGLYPGEELLENTFRISASVSYMQDNLLGLPYLNYEVLAKILKEEMQSETRLLETVASHILDRVMLEWPMADTATVKIEKLRPAFASFSIEAVVVEQTRIRN